MEAVANGSVGLFGQGFRLLRSSSARRRQRDPAPGADAAAVPEDGRASPPLSHGLSEEELRALIAQDLRSFIRRPMGTASATGATPARPFLLDRLMRIGA